MKYLSILQFFKSSPERKIVFYERHLISAAIVLTLFFISGCSNPEKVDISTILSSPIETAVNPSGRAPLTSILSFKTNEEVTVEVEVLGDIPIKKTYEAFNQIHEVPVLGLYSDWENRVAVRIVTKSGNWAMDTISITTDPLPEYFPDIIVTQAADSLMESGMHIFEFLSANNGVFDTYSILFDNQGYVRWYLDMSEAPRMSFTNYRLKNGNWLYGCWNKIYELDDLGTMVGEWDLKGYRLDHEIMELPNGNIIAGATKAQQMIVGADKQLIHSESDFVIEWDRKSNAVVREWDMKQHFDVDRNLLTDDRIPNSKQDWFHVNSVWYNESDSTLLVSGRNQGIAKVDYNNNLHWILAPWKGFDHAGPKGEGKDIQPFLLTAINDNNEPYDNSIQQGTSSTIEFEWPFGQHNPMVLPNGNIMVFDNGYMRNFNFDSLYSRAVEYEVNDVEKTIYQKWAYGRSAYKELFSAITSDVDYLPHTGHVLITYGNIRLSDKVPHARIKEMDTSSGEVYFDVLIILKDLRTPKEDAWGKFDVVYRSERMTL